jgi:hypothetical protein
VYLTQGLIAADAAMVTRVAQAAAAEGVADAGLDPDWWTTQWRRVWAAAPGWSEAWESALAAGNETPGQDPAVITDAQILSQVQGMMPFRSIIPPP